METWLFFYNRMEKSNERRIEKDMMVEALILALIIAGKAASKSKK